MTLTGLTKAYDVLQGLSKANITTKINVSDSTLSRLEARVASEKGFHLSDALTYFYSGENNVLGFPWENGKYLPFPLVYKGMIFRDTIKRTFDGFSAMIDGHNYAGGVYPSLVTNPATGERLNALFLFSGVENQTQSSIVSIFEDGTIAAGYQLRPSQKESFLIFNPNTDNESVFLARIAYLDEENEAVSPTLILAIQTMTQLAFDISKELRED